MDKCQLFLENCAKFKWFIERYFGESEFMRCKELAEANKEDELLNTLNRIWFYLPDNVFNIKENPDGWSEFLSIIEE